MDKQTKEEQEKRQEDRERRNKNRFYERLAVVLVFVLLFFTGLSLFIGPKEKLEFKFDKLTIKEDENIEEAPKIKEKPAFIDYSVEEMNRELNPEPKKISLYTPEERKRLAQIKKRQMQEILEKKFPKERITAKRYNRYIPQNTYNGSNYQSPLPQYSYTPEQPDDYFDILLENTTCSRKEIEYVLKLYTSVYEKPLTLVFRRNDHSSNVPEIIYATLPNNKWKDVRDSLGSIMQNLFMDILGEDDGRHGNLKKVAAMITTPCSNSQYVSQSFYVSAQPPVMTSVSGAGSFCNSQNGRLPDVLELISIITHKNMPSGYYITNSERLSTDRYGDQIKPLGDYIVIDYRNNDIFFTTTSKIPTKSVYTECVLK